jgi:phosphoenolpyruvate-protein kinase (PTS system EI component)
MGIPAVTGIASATSRIPTGAPVLVDGERGVVCVKPSRTAMQHFAAHKSSYDEDSSAAAAVAELQCATKDGTRISLLANINRPQEASLATSHHLDGVGLFRTEFMFLDSAEPPSFERQVRAYRQVIESVSPRPVCVRTLDLGGDKVPAFLTLQHETKANLGARGLRFSLAERTLLETQIRAVMAAAEDRPGVRLLLPMVLGAGDLSEALELVRTLSSQSGFAGKLEIGAMLETPAALFALDEIFQLADFVCIGTNDLTQYMLAADRDAAELADDYSVLHPGVLRAIAQVAQAGRSADREVSVCGEAASYPRTACLLVGLGVRQLSMSPRRAARVRYLLREMHLSQLQQLADQTLGARSTAQVKQLLQNLTP